MSKSSSTQSDKELTHAVTTRELYECLSIGDVYPGWGVITQKNWRLMPSGSYSVELLTRFADTENKAPLASWDTDLRALVLHIREDEEFHIVPPLHPAERYRLLEKKWTSVNVTCTFERLA